jgi:poly(3-hydroxybutyrate) depolymerase
MRVSILGIAVALLGKALADDDIILAPIQTDTSLPERLLIFLPGGKVPNEHYKLTGQAIQKAATDVRLTVVIPEVFQRLCIISCPFVKFCSVLKGRIDEAVAKSGFKGKNPKEDTFVAGHSLGGTCANNLLQAYSYEYAGLLEFAGFVEKTGEASVASYPIPVLLMAGEVDGGGARPSTMAGFYEQSKAHAQKHSVEEALKLKPVHVLEGLDHSDFCPGFFVNRTKDCKSEVSQDVALATIAEVAAAFMHLNSPVSEATRLAALAIMKKRLSFTQEMVEPFLTAFQLEKEQLASPPQGVPAGPWCSMAQHEIVGLNAADAGKLKIQPGFCQLITGGLQKFEHAHTNFSLLSDDSLEVTCCTAVEEPSFSIEGSQFASQSVDCKMIDATRAAQQLKVKTNASVQCGDINRHAVEVAKRLVPKKSLDRFEKKGRGVCFKEDTTVFGNIGPLWLGSKLTLDETTECLQVASSRLISDVNSKIYPGNHYCKLYSPSAAMDWIMTDSHKPFPYPQDFENDLIIQI